VAVAARELGIELLQPENLHAEDTLAAIAAAQPDALVVCAYGALVKEPLLSGYEILNVHPSLLPRWRGAAPLERAIMAGDEQTGVSIMRLTAGLDSGPVALQEPDPIGPDDDYGTLAARLEPLGSRLLIQALDERPPFAEQPEEGVTYAEKITAADRTLDPTRTPAEVERVVRALRPHIGARIPLPGDAGFLGVWAARVSPEPTLSAAGGRLRRDGDALLLDCNGGALELLEVQPPGGKRMPTAVWLRGRPDPRLTDFWLDPALPGRPLEAVTAAAIGEWDAPQEWAPNLAALCHRGDEEVLAAMRALAESETPRERAVAAFVLGQLGMPVRTRPAECAVALDELAAGEQDPGVLAAVAHAFGNLGAPHGSTTLPRLAAHPERAVREGVVRSLAGRDDPASVEALIALSADPDDEVRDWATFALGTLSELDTDALRGALLARVDDPYVPARVEAVHGLALRGDARGAEPVLAILADGDGHGIWSSYALEEATVLLAALTGDERFREHLPEPGERYAGTELGRALEKALARLNA
jgi:methionyl-tRNA formyltransferase